MSTPPIEMSGKVYYRAFAVFAAPETFPANEAVGFVFWKEAGAWKDWNPTELEECACELLKNPSPSTKLIRMFVERIDENLYHKIAARCALGMFSKIGESGCIVISDDF